MTAPLSAIDSTMRSLLIVIAIGTTILLSGCAGLFIVGAGVGAGAFSYIAGSLTRVYEADQQQSIIASVNVMEQHVIKPKEEVGNELKTIIEGYLKDDIPITIEVVNVSPGWTQIGVRAGYLGLDNLERSRQVHMDIEKELNRLRSGNFHAIYSNNDLTKPPALKATSQKKKFELSEVKPRISQTLYDTLPPPPAAASVVAQPDSAVDGTNGTREIAGLDEKSADDKATTLEKEDDGSSAPSMPVAAQTDSDLDGTRVITGLDEKPADDKTTTLKKEHDASSPPEEIVTAQIDRDSDDTEEIMERQETQMLSPAASKSTTFDYYPQSPLTIHSGSYGALDEAISYVHKNPFVEVDIIAYTDPSDTIASNIVQSEKRVSEIRNYLILNGISEERITVQVKQAANSPVNNQTAQLETANPHVELSISAMDDTEQRMEREKAQMLSPTSSKSTTFEYYPQSLLTIHSGSYGALDDAISYAHKNPVVEVDIIAYTDASDTAASTIAQSQKRASEIRNYFILNGISEEKITAQVVQTTNSQANTQTAEHESSNPHVEISIK